MGRALLRMSAFSWLCLVQLLVVTTVQMQVQVQVEAFTPAQFLAVGATATATTATAAANKHHAGQGTGGRFSSLNEANSDADIDIATEDSVTDSASVPESESEIKDVPILSVDSVPSLPDNAVVNVYYVETTINALGIVGEVIEGYHAGLIFEIKGQTDNGNNGNSNNSAKECSGDPAALAKKWGVPLEFTIEWYATNFPFGAFLPAVKEVTEDDPIGLQWENEAFAYYYPGVVKDKWDTGKTLVGYLDGKAFRKYIHWTIEYQKRRPGYQAFEVWDRPQLDPKVTRRWVESATCSTFAEESLREMWNLGGKSDHPEQILRRSYVPIVSRTKPQIVDRSDPLQQAQVREFFIELNKAARGVDGKSLTTPDFIRLLADRLEVFYVYDVPSDTYRKINLSPPYFALANLYQPMSLPWQLLDINGDGRLVDIGAFAPEGSGEDTSFESQSFANEFSKAAESIGKLVGRKLPDIVSNKLDSKLTFVACAAGVIVVATVINKSFVVGLVVGVALGAFGPQIVSTIANSVDASD